jgi:tetratricopeptide (TPR) repeat protein
MRFLNWFNIGRTTPTSYYQTGLRLAREKRWGEAVTCFSTALAINPSSLSARLARANAYFLMEEWDQAIADFSHILQSNGQSVEALVGRASTYMSKASNIVERYRKGGGKQYDLSFEELTTPMDDLMRSVSPEKALWIRITNAMMDLQAAAKKDAEEALRCDPQNRLAQELLRSLSW